MNDPELTFLEKSVEHQEKIADLKAELNMVDYEEFESLQKQVEEILNENRLLHAKVETITVRFNEVLIRLQVMLNMKLDHLKVPEDDEK